MDFFTHIALIGPTASGKTSLALELADRYGGIILSLDSLSVYRHIDIASAKPTPAERGAIEHFGLDRIDPDAAFDVVCFIEEYRRAAARARRLDVPLIIVGGSGFYLKTLIDGISPMPQASEEITRHVQKLLNDLPFAYEHLQTIDPVFAAKITPADRYRIEKGLLIHYASGESPHEWFTRNPPVPVIDDPLRIYEIAIPRDLLRERITLRTGAMLRAGLIDEVAYLERTYTRAPHCMKAIGIRETLDYLDGRTTRTQLREAIITHTAQLAKRQVTYNKSQFTHTIRKPLPDLRKELL